MTTTSYSEHRNGSSSASSLDWRSESRCSECRCARGRKKRGSSTSTRSRPSRVSAMRSALTLGEVAVASQRVERAAKRSSTSTPYFCAKYDGRERAALQLQHELADQPLFVGRAIGAAERDLAALDRGAVRLPRVEVLHVHAVDVAERRDAEADEIRAFPQPIAIDELRRRRILDRGVGAADVIAGALERRERLLTQRRFVAQSATGSANWPVALQQVAADRRVVRQLHLVDGDAVGIERRACARCSRASSSSVSPSMPAIRSMLICGKPSARAASIRRGRSPASGARGRSARGCDRRSSRRRG